MMSSADIGSSGRKRMRFQDEIEWIERRRSSRIIALEEKKQKEKQRKVALALERKNKSMNHDKEKGKATMEVDDDDLSDFNEDEEGPTKKGYKSTEFYQLISSIKELARHSKNVGTSRINVSSFNGMPLKNILRIIIDFLQRKDSDELFAQPINLDVVGNYYDIVKQPMDFGTMRAKIHEGFYTDIEQFKRDVFLMCSNGESANTGTPKYHQMAEDISRFAKCVFEALADPQLFDSELSLDKARPSKKPQNGQQGTSLRVSPKPVAERNNPTPHVKVSETKKRHMYWPPNKSLISEVLRAGNPGLQMNTDTIKYKESLLRFVKNLGPVAQRVAAKKLEALRDQQQTIQCNVDTPTPQTQQQPAPFNDQTLALALPFLNKSHTVPGSAAQQNRIVNNTTNAIGGRVNIRDNDPYNKRMKPIITNDNWQSCAAAVLSSNFFNKNDNNIGECSGGIESSRSLFPRGISPTSVISGPQPKQLKSLMPQPRLENTMPSINHLESSLVVSQTRPQNLMPCMPSNNNITQFSLGREPRADDFVNLSDLFRVPQQRPRDSMYDMPSNNLTEPSLVHNPCQPNSMNGLNPPSVPPLYQPNIQGMSVSSTLDSSYINDSTSTMLQANHEQVLHQAAPYTSFDLQMQNHSSYFQLNETVGDSSSSVFGNALKHIFTPSNYQF